MAKRQPEMSDRERTWMVALALLMTLRGFKDPQLAAELHVSRSSITHRRNGHTRLRAGDVDRIAGVLEVPASLFDLDKAGIRAWFEEHPEMSVLLYGCMQVTADQSTRATAA